MTRVGGARRAFMQGALAAALLAAGASGRSSQAVSAAPVEVRARGVEFRSHDEATGALEVHLIAESAAMVGPEAELQGARLARYDDSGRLVFGVRAAKGSYTRGKGVRLSGPGKSGVEIEWRFRGGAAAFRCEDIAWDEASDSFGTDSAVLGHVLRREADGSSVVDLAGRGFAFVTPESRGEIVRDAVVCMDSRRGRRSAFRATADRGLVFEAAGDEGGLVIRMRGPVATVLDGSSARADGLKLRFAPGDGGELDLEGGTFRGTVRAVVSLRDRQGDASGLLPGSLFPRLLGPPEGRRKPGAADHKTELRADVIEVKAASRTVVLYGTPADPARVIFDGGELRGTRIDLGEGRAATDGGAPSEFVW